MDALDSIHHHRVFLFFGMFGSGKTELSINWSLYLKTHFQQVALADIDTISPYFRSRDETDHMARRGVQVITPPKPLMKADLPIIAPQVGGFIQNPAYHVVIDVGGNDVGATVLGSLHHFLDAQNYISFFVINAQRPFSTDVESIKANIDQLSMKGRVRVDFLINNTHLGAYTDQPLIERGEDIVRQVSESCGVPFGFTAQAKDFFPANMMPHNSFPLELHMNTTYEGG